jgi:hypothetical protein
MVIPEDKKHGNNAFEPRIENWVFSYIFRKTRFHHKAQSSLLIASSFCSKYCAQLSQKSPVLSMYFILSRTFAVFLQSFPAQTLYSCALSEIMEVIGYSTSYRISDDICCLGARELFSADIITFSWFSLISLITCSTIFFLSISVCRRSTEEVVMLYSSATPRGITNPMDCAFLDPTLYA